MSAPNLRSFTTKTTFFLSAAMWRGKRPSKGVARFSPLKSNKGKTMLYNYNTSSKLHLHLRILFLNVCNYIILVVEITGNVKFSPLRMKFDQSGHLVQLMSRSPQFDDFIVIDETFLELLGSCQKRSSHDGFLGVIENYMEFGFSFFVYRNPTFITQFL